MAWGKVRQGGWGQTPEDDPVTRFSQVIHTVMSVVSGGVIRHEKTGPDDDAHVGFWLGVGADGVARFSVGGLVNWLKWTGTELLVRARLSTLGGDGVDDRLRWIGADSEDIAYLAATDAWGHQLEIGTPRADATGEPSQIDLLADGDFGASVRLRLVTERGAGAAGSWVLIQVGTGRNVMTIDGNGHMWVRGRLDCADATADTHALNRRTADARYLPRAVGWSGTFRTDEIATVTVVNGQITGVA